MSIPKWQEKRSFWTWGFESDEPDESTRSAAAKSVSERFGREVSPPPIPKVSEIELRKPRLEVPSALTEFVSSDHAERVLHTHGGHPLELLSALRGQFESPPDAVAHPRTEDELEAVLAWCDEKGHTAIPYGGATSVVWGVCVPQSSDSAVTIDLDHFHRVLEIDPISRAARIQAGVFGPDLCVMPWP